jgi:hypothetical protein
LSFVIKQESIAKFPNQSSNPKTWAHRINYRHLWNDNSLLSVQVAFAREALGDDWLEQKPHALDNGYRADIE